MSNTGREQVNPNRVFVGGISWKADEVSLANFFSAYGAVVECKIIMDKVTGKSKGYGFVTFQDLESANNVKQATNLYFLGKMMNVGDAVRKGESAGGHMSAQGGAGRFVEMAPHQMAYQPIPYGFNPYYGSPPYYPQPFYANMNGFVPVAYQFNPMYAQQQFATMDPQAPPFTQVPGWQPITPVYGPQQQKTSPPTSATPSPTSASPKTSPRAYQPAMQPNIQQPAK